MMWVDAMDMIEGSGRPSHMACHVPSTRREYNMYNSRFAQAFTFAARKY